MNIKYTTFLIVLLVAQLGFSQVKITGKVIDAQEVSIEGSNIILINPAKKQNGVTSGLEGDFTIEAKETGVYTIRVTYLGFKPFTKTITILANQNINLGEIVLQESSESLQSIEVLGRIRKE